MITYYIRTIKIWHAYDCIKLNEKLQIERCQYLNLFALQYVHLFLKQQAIRLFQNYKWLGNTVIMTCTRQNYKIYWYFYCDGRKISKASELILLFDRMTIPTRVILRWCSIFVNSPQLKRTICNQISRSWHCKSLIFFVLRGLRVSNSSFNYYFFPVLSIYK